MPGPVATSLAVECVIEGGSFGLGSTEVERVIECDVSALPLASPAIAGIGVHEGSIVLLVWIPSAGKSSPPATPGVRKARGALLVRKAEGGARWAIEVSEVRSLIRLHETASASGGSGPAWLLSTKTDDGRDVPSVDVQRLLSTL